MKKSKPVLIGFILATPIAITEIHARGCCAPNAIDGLPSFSCAGVSLPAGIARRLPTVHSLMMQSAVHGEYNAGLRR
jgi:hypothetical protein